MSTHEIATTEEIARQLDTVIGILKLAHREELESARDWIRSNKVNAAILDGARLWIKTAKLQKAIAKKTDQSERTIRNYIADLVNLGVLEKRGAGTATEYRATGLI